MWQNVIHWTEIDADEEEEARWADDGGAVN